MFLIIQYFKLVMINKTVRMGLCKAMLSDQIEALYFCLCLYLNLFLVDEVLCKECDKSNAASLLTIIIAFRVCPFPIIHYLTFRECFWKVGGASRITLQSNLLRKFLNYSEEARLHVDESKLIMAMSRDINDLVADGVCKIVPLISALTRL